MPVSAQDIKSRKDFRVLCQRRRVVEGVSRMK